MGDIGISFKSCQKHAGFKILVPYYLKEGDIIKLKFENQFQQSEYCEFDLEDVFFTASRLEFGITPTNEFTMVGKAVIDGEEYTDFMIKFATVTVPDEYTLESILSLDWEWYDFVF